MGCFLCRFSFENSAHLVTGQIIAIVNAYKTSSYTIKIRIPVINWLSGIYGVFPLKFPDFGKNRILTAC